VASVTVSVDGTEEAHDRQRGVPGSYRAALEAISHLDAAGVPVGVTTQVNRLSLPSLGRLAPELEAAGALGWQLQLTLPMGRAERAVGLVLSPREMPAVLDVVRTLVARRGLRPHLTDSLGYFTRDDPLLRSPHGGRPRVWLGCFAGLRHLGITSDGRVKGCLALPDSQVGGTSASGRSESSGTTPRSSD
jgi:MoaA/NifB/PqqE/SkfB family radical SAM enzyme